MKVSLAPVFALLTMFSCDTNSDRPLDSEINQGYLKGHFAVGDSTLNEFSLWACFCNMTDSGIKITNTNNGFEGQELVTFLDKGDTAMSFNTWTCVGRPPKYDLLKYSVSLNKNQFSIQDSLMGTMSVYGTFYEGQIKKNFKIDGQFRCVLRDSTYDFLAYQADMIRILNGQELKKLKQVSLINPDSVKEIELGSFDLTEIPIEIRRFKKLRKLSLAQNQIMKLDLSLLANLDSLAELDLSGNPITEFTGDIKTLRNIEVLNLSGCDFKSIPKGLFDLSKLKVLDLSATPLITIPNGIQNLKDLQVLDLGYSDVSIIPKEIFQLPKLTSLSLPDSIQLFKLNGSNLKLLKKLEVPYELIEFNKTSLQSLTGLENLSISFAYKDSREEQINHSDRVRFVEEALPTVRIFESIEIKD